MSTAERLQKIIAQAGITSRRKAESMIQLGRVTVNGKVAVLGTKATVGKDDILLDGKPIQKPELKVTLRLNKPRGYITALKDDKGRPVVTDLLKGISERVYPIGRLDYDSEGVLLFTNDGKLAHALAHPQFQITKTYHVKVKKSPSTDKLKQLEYGIQLEDGISKAISIQRMTSTDAGNSWIEVVLAEGKYREIRRMFDAIGHPVMRLKRVSFAEVYCHDLYPGEYALLSENEVKQLITLTGIHYVPDDF